jgi:hemolysin III
MMMRMIGRLREPVNGLSHLLAALLAIAGVVALLIVGRSTIDKEISLLIYGCTLVLLFSASATYHLVQASPRAMAALRKLDHAAIYLLIAGTYTPFCYNMFSGFWKWGLLATVWSLALVGLIVKVFIMRTPRWLNAGLYLLLGWSVILGLQEMLAVLPAGALVCLATGGILYTVGAVIYITKVPDFIPGKFGFHEVWHIFVMLGALAHFAAVIAYVAPAA